MTDDVPDTLPDEGIALVEGAPALPDGPVTDPDARKRARRRRRLVILTVVVAFVVARRSGAFDAITDADRLQELVDGMGPAGPFAFALLFTLLVPVGVPGLVFVLPAAVVFTPPVALAVSLAGGYGSSAIGMFAARTVARERLSARLPERFRRWDERIAQRGLLAVIALRVVTYLAAPADWLLGITAIPTRHLVVGTAIGLIPPTLLYVYGGGGVLDALLG